MSSAPSKTGLGLCILIAACSMAVSHARTAEQTDRESFSTLPAFLQTHAEAVEKLLQTRPGFAHYLDGSYDDEAVHAAYETLSAEAVHAKADATPLRELAERYRPIYRFSQTFTRYCTPLTWSEANREVCLSQMPARVPVYVSYSFRRAENGGGSHSVWINYHVFYGRQRGFAGAGAHGDDWEVTSILFVNGTPSAVRYRVHGSALNTMPFKSARRSGDQIWVYPGYYFHGGYPNGGCPALPFLTWNDCRGETYVIDSQVLDCSFNAPGGDSCTHFPANRNLWTEDTYASKDSSAPTRFDWQIESDVRPTASQLCYATEAGWRGIVDCIDSSPGGVRDLGRTFNDRISSYWYAGPAPAGTLGFRVFEHADFGGRSLDAQSGSSWRNLPSDFNDRPTSLRPIPAN